MRLLAVHLRGILRRAALRGLTAVVLIGTAADGVEASPDDLPILIPSFPNFAGVGFGFTPDYLGSDDMLYGAVPVLRYQRPGQFRHIMLTGTILEVNAVDHPTIRFGPVAQYRFGRSDVKDAVVDRLPDIDPTLEAGVFGAFEYTDPQDPRRYFRIGASVHADTLDAYDGFLLNVSTTLLRPTPFFEFGISAGLTWADDNYASTYFDVTTEGAAASGLPVYAAGAGMRDARLVLGAFVPVFEQCLVGAGIMFQQILGDAADSPLVDDRGAAFQVSGGIGIAYYW